VSGCAPRRPGFDARSPRRGTVHTPAGSPVAGLARQSFSCRARYARYSRAPEVRGEPRGSSDELQDAEPGGILSIPTEPQPAAATAPHQLSDSTHAAGQHFIDDQIEAHPRAGMRVDARGPRDGDRHAVSGCSAAPAAAHLPPPRIGGHRGRDTRVRRGTCPHGVTVLVRNDEVADWPDAVVALPPDGRRKIDLQAVR